MISSRAGALQTAVVAALDALEAQSVTVEINLVKNAHAFQKFQATLEYFGKTRAFVHLLLLSVRRYNRNLCEALIELFAELYRAFIFRKHKKK